MHTSGIMRTSTPPDWKAAGWAGYGFGDEHGLEVGFFGGADEYGITVVVGLRVELPLDDIAHFWNHAHWHPTGLESGRLGRLWLRS
jgi:hypothetical protein